MGKELRQFLLLLLLSWLISSSQFSIVSRKLLQDDGEDPSPRGGEEGLMEENDVLEEDPSNGQRREEPTLREEPSLPAETDATFQEEPTRPIDTETTEEEASVGNNRDNLTPPLRSSRPQMPERVEEEDPNGSSVGSGGVMNEVDGGLPLGYNGDPVLEETIDETTPLDCSGPEDCQNANGVLNTFFRRCSGFYDEQCCIALRAAGAGRVSPCCWDHLCSQTAPFGGETYLADCMNRTC